MQILMWVKMMVMIVMTMISSLMMMTWLVVMWMIFFAMAADDVEDCRLTGRLVDELMFRFCMRR